jgi:redox-sensitive bicupin YhaK (pirin superfamily)
MSIRLIEGHVRDLGGFSVARVLPAPTMTSVGPFVFFDHLGPVDFQRGQGIAVRPHPHIGLATVTYLFEGAMMHRDSIGSVQEILPGDVNWMAAGQGVVHSERSPESLRQRGHRVHGIQIWVAQSENEQAGAPSFRHVPKHELPILNMDGAELRLVIGEAFGLRAPILHSLPLYYVHARLDAGARLTLPAEFEQRAIYAVDAPVRIDDTPLQQGALAVLGGAASAVIEARAPATVMLFGGAALETPRYLNWNFVATSQALIDQARTSWRSYPNAKFPAVPGETESIPLPEH